MRANIILWGGLVGAVALYLYSRTESGAATVANVTDYLGDLVTPRGIRNNNPGNIERNNIRWQGALSMDQLTAQRVAWDPLYVQFDVPANGVRAIGHVLQAKAARGLTSVDALIRNYSATNQDAYVANVSAALGVDPGDTIDVYAQLPNLALAIIQQENGQQPYNPDDVAGWVYS